jgi:hypothetical protein
MRPLLLLALLLAGAVTPATGATDCLPVIPLALTIRIGTEPPGPALLIGGDAPALRIVDAQTGDTLWSAGAAPPATQRFAAMTSAFAGSFIALDTNRDGLHDRLYAGDLAGQLWRFDLHNGAAAANFASGGVFADFRNAAGRGFHAPPDVSLAKVTVAMPWFEIALGTAAPGRVGANNRFYVLRDHAPFESWTDAQYRNWQPLRETDLLPVTTAGEPARSRAQAGWFIELHTGDVLTASLTVAGRTLFAIAESSATISTDCRSAFSIATLDLVQVRLLPASPREWRSPLPGTIALGTSFAFKAAGTDTAATSAHCTFGAAYVPGCDVDLRPRRTWWRREDAE